MQRFLFWRILSLLSVPEHPYLGVVFIQGTPEMKNPHWHTDILNNICRRIPVLATSALHIQLFSMQIQIDMCHYKKLRLIYKCQPVSEVAEQYCFLLVFAAE